MALVRFDVPFNMAAAQTWFGTVTGATSTQLVLSNGFNTALYEGSFTYSGLNVFGTLSTFSQFNGSSLAFRVTGLSLNANVVQTFVDGNKLPALFEYALQGADTIWGSNGADILFGYAGSDVLQGYGGNDVLDGGLGTDTAKFTGAKADYEITQSGGTITVRDKTAGRDGTDTLLNFELLAFADQTVSAASLVPFPTLVTTHASQFKALAAAYQTFLGGIPSAGGFEFVINGNVATNFGAGGGVTFNDENIFINVVNALVQGNATAAQKFATIAAGSTLAQKVASIYAAVIPAAKQSADGVAFLTRPDGLKFYQDVAAQRGVTGENGAAVIALASMLKIAVDAKSGVGNPVSDLFLTVTGGASALPAGSAGLLPIELYDGTAFDADDGPDVLPGFSGPPPIAAAGMSDLWLA